jgi:hypothetical protein
VRLNWYLDSPVKAGEAVQAECEGEEYLKAESGQCHYFPQPKLIPTAMSLTLPISNSDGISHHHPSVD